MSNQPHVLVTGSAGRLGRAAVASLIAAGHSVKGFDLVRTPGLADQDSIIGSITNREAFVEAAKNAHCIIHLAASPDDHKNADGQILYDPNDFPDKLVPNNVLGTYYILEAARINGVRNVVLASSGQVVDGHLEANHIPVKANVEFLPRYLYACTKVMLEQLGRVYSEHHGLSVLAVRFGWCPRDLGQVKEIAADPMAQDVFLSPGDVGSFCVACARAKLPPFSQCFVTSRFTHHLTYDLSDAKRLLNWEPKDQWPTGAEAF